MLFRLYNPEDFAALYSIEEMCFRPPFRFTRRYMKKLVDARNSATWIAEDAAVAGFAIVEWSHEIRGISAYIQTIEVAPAFRGRGIGGELLGRMQDTARAAGALVLWLHVDAENVAAIRLYETHGYVKFGSEDHFYAPGRGALIYRKSLVEDAPEAI